MAAGSILHSFCFLCIGFLGCTGKTDNNILSNNNLNISLWFQLHFLNMAGTRGVRDNFLLPFFRCWMCSSLCCPSVFPSSDFMFGWIFLFFEILIWACGSQIFFHCCLKQEGDDSWKLKRNKFWTQNMYLVWEMIFNDSLILFCGSRIRLNCCSVDLLVKWWMSCSRICIFHVLKFESFSVFRFSCYSIAISFLICFQVQLIRIQLRVPEYGWTTQKVFHLMNFIVTGCKFCFFFLSGIASC